MGHIFLWPGGMGIKRLRRPQALNANQIILVHFHFSMSYPSTVASQILLCEKGEDICGYGKVRPRSACRFQPKSPDSHSRAD